jgi:preprotein translocase subunit SecE
MADAKKTATAGGGGDLPAPPRAKGGGIIQFIREVRREWDKVTWPTWKETYLTTILVFIMVGLMMLFFFVVDALLNIGVRYLLGVSG